MQIIENSKVKEKLYIEKLENGLTVMIIPKKGIQKKYIIWGTNYGSNDKHFYRGELIRLEAINLPSHEAYEIYQEMEKGVYI